MSPRESDVQPVSGRGTRQAAIQCLKWMVETLTASEATSTGRTPKVEPNGKKRYRGQDTADVASGSSKSARTGVHVARTVPKSKPEVTYDLQKQLSPQQKHVQACFLTAVMVAERPSQKLTKAPVTDTEIVMTDEESEIVEFLELLKARVSLKARPMQTRIEVPMASAGSTAQEKFPVVAPVLRRSSRVAARAMRQ